MLKNKPLKNIRVLDLTNVLAGPFCCHQLAFLGADVIKVENPQKGDLARQLGGQEELNQKLMGISFLAQNAGKRSVTVNLKNEEGKKLFLALADTADVVVENFRPGVMERLGLGYEVLSKRIPKLVYCAISGYGQEGPLKAFPAYDQIVQGMSGVMSITGDEKTAPYRVGYPVSDTIGGITAAFAISSALLGREIQGGCFLDVAMLDSTLATMGWVISNYLIGRQEPFPVGNENFTASPSGTFATADGLLNIAANKQEQYIALCGVLGREDLIEHPMFKEREARKTHRSELKAELEKELKREGAEHWMEKLNAAGIPAGVVLTVPEALNHPQIAERDFIAKFSNVSGVENDVRVVKTGFKISGSSTAVDSPPPLLGEHNLEIFSQLGFSDQEIDELKEKGAI
ncbi:MAG: CoA transferase [SAR324 cluster bacterium]|nr:CoA transferase [SAR324 cluster bacterium]